MDTQQLKLLAEPIRGLLQQSNHSIGHNQSLDLAAALPGLRNWPEVMAFPDRVAACELDTASAGRLAFRLKKRFGLDMAVHAVLAALSPSGNEVVKRAPHVWPAGPLPGVYVTTSQAAIDALLERYEDATDGALVYAERAGNHWSGSIDLGEHGLWSAGLDRVPSGTLLLVGPLEADQQSWSDCAERLEMACLHALNSGHRVAVLLDTPTPDALREDVRLMVVSRPEHSDHETALLGIVTDDGDLEVRTPFAHPWPLVEQRKSPAMTNAMPTPILAPLRDALVERTTGLLLFGSAIIAENSAMELVAASLALTEHVGPAARVMPRHRSTLSKDWDVPEAIRQLPYLPSIESAYDQGYRRIIYHPNYTKAESLMQYSGDALLISGTFGSDVMEVFMGTLRGGGMQKEQELLGRIIAIAATVPLPTKGGPTLVSDFYVSNEQPIDHLKEFEDIERFLFESRSLTWQDELSRLLDAGLITAAAVKKAFPRNRGIGDYLAGRAKRKEATEAA